MARESGRCAMMNPTYFRYLDKLEWHASEDQVRIGWQVSPDCSPALTGKVAATRRTRPLWLCQRCADLYRQPESTVPVVPADKWHPALLEGNSL